MRWGTPCQLKPFHPRQHCDPTEHHPAGVPATARLFQTMGHFTAPRTLPVNATQGGLTLGLRRKELWALKGPSTNWQVKENSSSPNSSHENPDHVNSHQAHLKARAVRDSSSTRGWVDENQTIHSNLEKQDNAPTHRIRSGVCGNVLSQWEHSSRGQASNRKPKTFTASVSANLRKRLTA